MSENQNAPESLSEERDDWNFGDDEVTETPEVESMAEGDEEQHQEVEAEQPKEQESDAWKGAHGGRWSSPEDAVRDLANRDRKVEELRRELDELRGQSRGASPAVQQNQQPDPLPSLIPKGVLEQVLAEGDPRKITDTVDQYVASRVNLLGTLAARRIDSLETQVKSLIEQRLAPIEHQSRDAFMARDFAEADKEFGELIGDLPQDVQKELGEGLKQAIVDTLKLYIEEYAPGQYRFFEQPPSAKAIMTDFFGRQFGTIKKRVLSNAANVASNRERAKGQFANNMAPSHHQSPNAQRQLSKEEERAAYDKRILSEIVRGNFR